MFVNTFPTFYHRHDAGNCLQAIAVSQFMFYDFKITYSFSVLQTGGHIHRNVQTLKSDTSQNCTMDKY